MKDLPQGLGHVRTILTIYVLRSNDHQLTPKSNKKNVFNIFDNLVDASKKKWNSELKKQKNSLIFLDPGNNTLIKKLNQINFPI